tara:strand:- start:1389 stop:1988 length:600 start_codon:yes stop_codon:yes gene_type:complete
MFEIFDIIDKNILLWVHKNHFPLFDQLMPFITDSDNWIIPIILLILGLGFRGGKRGKIALALLIISLSFNDYICAQILKPFFGRIRPSHISLDGLNLLVSKGGKWSMPSNHASNIFTLTVILSYFYSKVKLPLYSFAILIALSRVYVGVHYPGDVIAGSVFGYSVGWLVITFWVIIKMRELKRRKTWIWYESDPPIFKN